MFGLYRHWREALVLNYSINRSMLEFTKMKVISHDYSSNHPGKSTQMAHPVSSEITASLSQRGAI